MDLMSRHMVLSSPFAWPDTICDAAVHEGCKHPLLVIQSDSTKRACIVNLTTGRSETNVDLSLGVAMCPTSGSTMFAVDSQEVRRVDLQTRQKATVFRFKLRQIIISAAADLAGNLCVVTKDRFEQSRPYVCVLYMLPTGEIRMVEQFACTTCTVNETWDYDGDFILTGKSYHLTCECCPRFEEDLFKTPYKVRISTTSYATIFTCVGQLGVKACAAASSLKVSDGNNGFLYFTVAGCVTKVTWAPTREEEVTLPDILDVVVGVRRSQQYLIVFSPYKVYVYRMWTRTLRHAWISAILQA
jgi:hypothetical protein